MKITEQIINIPSRTSINATRIYVKKFSSEKVSQTRGTMLMLPGGPGNSHEVYDTEPYSIARALSSNIDVILFDPRGCGHSNSSPIEECNLNHYIDDIAAIRDALNLNPKELIIFGQSYGSLAALGYAIKYPHDLKQLIIIGGATSSHFIEDAKKNLEKIATVEQLEAAKRLWQGNFSHDPDEMACYYKVMAPLYSSTYQAKDEASVIDCNIDILNYGWGCFLKNFDYSHNLHTIISPTHIFWGKDDWIFDLKQASLLTEKIETNQLEIFQNCGHLLWVDAWEKFINRMIEITSTS